MYDEKQVMQDVGRKYVRYINRTYSRTGTLWEGRFKSCLVDSDAYLLTCMCYIEMNPVRADMVSHPGDYPWSSYACNASNVDNKIIQAHQLYNELGETNQSRQSAYQALFNHQPAADDMCSIRDMLNQELVLGRDDFKEKIEAMTKRQTRSGKGGRSSVKEAQGIYSI